MNCSNCESTLLTDVFNTPNPVRCSACGEISIPRIQNFNQVNRFAWRSFWLGLTSIVLLFLTGIPAIWYGIRSLRQMRFMRSQKNDRKAAIAGISMGLLFGILGSCIAALFGGFALIFTFLMEETKEPERIQEILAMAGTIEIPDGFHPVEAKLMMSEYQRIEWRDGLKPETANGRARLLKAKHSAFSEAQRGSTMNLSLHGGIKTDSSSRRSNRVSWQFAGQERDVTKTTIHAKQDDFEIHRYSASTKSDGEDEYFLLVVNIRVPGKYSEEDVKKMFESFQQ